MAIDTADVHRFSAADKRFVIQSHATPGTGENDITTGLDYIDIVLVVCGTTADKCVIATPNASDDAGTASNGHFCLHAEANVTCYSLAIGR